LLEYNIITIPCINYIIIRINNIAAINNNYRRLQDHIFLFKISMCTRKDFFEIYKKLGQAPSHSFASRGLKAAAIRSLSCRPY